MNTKLNIKINQGNNLSILYINGKKEGMLEPRSALEINISQFNRTGSNTIGKILITNSEKYASHKLSLNKSDDFEDCFMNIKNETTPQIEPFQMLNNLEFEWNIPNGYMLNKRDISGE